MPNPVAGDGAQIVPSNDPPLDERIADLAGLPIADLRLAWSDAWGTPPPKGARRRLLMLGIAWKWQADILGGMSRQLERRLEALQAGFRQGGRISDRERHVQDPGERLGEEGLAATGRSEEHDVRLLEFDVAVALFSHADPLVVVVNSNGKCPLGGFLADHVLVKDRVDLLGTGKPVEVETGRRSG